MVKEGDIAVFIPDNFAVPEEKYGRYPHPIVFIKWGEICRIDLENAEVNTKDKRIIFPLTTTTWNEEFMTAY